MKLSISILSNMLLVALTVLLFNCTKETPQITGSGTTTQGGFVCGYIINGITGAPVPNAEVTLVTSNNIPSPVLAKSAATDMVNTDTAGYYNFDKVSAGTYNILASKDSLSSFHDSIIVSEEGSDAGHDTLRRAGSIAGRILLGGTDDPRTVMILVIGTNVFNVPYNADGNFTLSNLGQGDYSVRFLSTLDSYYPLDTVLYVSAGLHDTLSTPVRLPVRGVQTVSGLSVTWDSLQLKANVSWQLLDTAIVSGYKVFRGIIGKPLPSTPINPYLIVENTFTDSTCGEDSSYYYFVAAVNRSGQQGNYSNTDTIHSVSSYTLINVLDGITLGTSWTQFAVRDAKLYWLNQNKVEVHDTTGALLNSYDLVISTDIDDRPSSPKIYGDTLFIISTNLDKKNRSIQLNIEKFSLSDSYLGRDSFTISSLSNSLGPLNGDITKGKTNTIFYTNGNNVYHFQSDGTYDSIVSPLSSGMRHPIQRIEFVDSLILYPMSVKELTTNQVTTEIALLNQDLSTNQLFRSNWYLQGFSVSPSGEIFLITDAYLRIVTKEMATVKKVPIPASLYKDVEIDTDGTVYLYDYKNKKILIYKQK